MTVKVYAMTCGWINGAFDLMMADTPGRIRFPVPAYLIDHPKGRVLFDSGLHPDIQSDVRGRAGDTLADLFEVEFRPGEEIKARLKAFDIAADSISTISSTRTSIGTIPAATRWSPTPRSSSSKKNGKPGMCPS